VTNLSLYKTSDDIPSAVHFQSRLKKSNSNSIQQLRWPDTTKWMDGFTETWWCPRPVRTNFPSIAEGPDRLCLCFGLCHEFPSRLALECSVRWWKNQSNRRGI